MKIKTPVECPEVNFFLYYEKITQEMRMNATGNGPSDIPNKVTDLSRKILNSEQEASDSCH